MAAVQRNDETLVELFLRFGVSVNALMHLPFRILTPLGHAGTRRMVEMLLAKGADPNLQCPLGQAIKWRRVSAAEALLRGGAEVNAFDSQGLTPLSHMAKRGSGYVCQTTHTQHHRTRTFAHLMGPVLQATGEVAAAPRRGRKPRQQ